MDHLLMVLVLLWSSGLQAEDKHQPTGKKREYISSGLGMPLIPQEELEDVTRTSISSQCESTAKADIVLLVCESKSITSEDYENIKSFLTQIVNNFNIGPDKVQIDMVQYISGMEWELNTYQTKQTVLEAIANLQETRERSILGEALHYIFNIKFKPKVGMRAESQKIAILITDGESQDDAFLASQRLRDTSVEIYTIGVKDANETRLRTIASDPDDIHMYSVSDSSSLPDIVDKLSINLCKSVNSLEPVRLVGGASRCAGTLEVKRALWKPVHYSDWSLKEAAVVCRELDCGSVVSTRSRNEPSDRSVWRINPDCVKSGSALRECASSSSSSSIVELTCSGKSISEIIYDSNIFLSLSQ
ncbi:collagen alpha-1(XII) chain-like [Thunnus thynnus]|uniref:collagen alpha-1(XII) chain-like n=1 Tax=Thunnus thynnus TaxID=8237 RepID=UPI0035298FD4